MYSGGFHSLDSSVRKFWKVVETLTSQVCVFPRVHRCMLICVCWCTYDCWSVYLHFGFPKRLCWAEYSTQIKCTLHNGVCMCMCVCTRAPACTRTQEKCALLKFVTSCPRAPLLGFQARVVVWACVCMKMCVCACVRVCLWVCTYVWVCMWVCVCGCVCEWLDGWMCGYVWVWVWL